MAGSVGDLFQGEMVFFLILGCQEGEQPVHAVPHELAHRCRIAADDGAAARQRLAQRPGRDEGVSQVDVGVGPLQQPGGERPLSTRSAPPPRRHRPCQGSPLPHRAEAPWPALPDRPLQENDSAAHRCGSDCLTRARAWHHATAGEKHAGSSRGSPAPDCPAGARPTKPAAPGNGVWFHHI